MSKIEERVRELAYQIWESEGRPHGEDARHWEMAQKLASSEVADAKPEAKPRASRAKAKLALTEVASKPAAKPKASKPKPAEGNASAVAKKPRAPRKPAAPKV